MPACLLPWDDWLNTDVAVIAAHQVKLLLAKIALVDEDSEHQAALFGGAQVLLKSRLHHAQRRHGIPEAVNIQRELLAELFTQHTAELDGSHCHGR
jgi:hypothetical protein